MATKTKCGSCDSATINGVYCHETGCPDAYKTEIRSCKWCGSEPEPEHPRQQFCENLCYAYYYGQIARCNKSIDKIRRELRHGQRAENHSYNALIRPETDELFRLFEEVERQ